MARRSFKRILSRARGRTNLMALGVLALTAGGVVLLRAPTYADFDTSFLPPGARPRSFPVDWKHRRSTGQGLAVRWT